MKKRIFSYVLILALTLGLAVPVWAEEEPSKAGVTVNGEEVYYTAEIYDGTAYIPFYNGVQTLRPDAEITWADGIFTAAAEDLTMTVRVGDPYLVVNGRYLWEGKGLGRRDGLGSRTGPCHGAGRLGGLEGWNSRTLLRGCAPGGSGYPL